MISKFIILIAVVFASLFSVSKVEASSIPSRSVASQEINIDSNGDQTLESRYCVNCGNTNSLTSTLSKFKQLASQFVGMLMKKISDNPISRKISEIASKVKNSRSLGYCWKSVKSMLVSSGTVKYGELTTRYARQADVDLKKQGFVDLMAPGQPLAQLKDPCLAPKGAVLVYEGGNPYRFNHSTGTYQNRCDGKPCGHTEIKVGDVGDSRVASDYSKRVPVTGGCSSSGHGYKLKAIMVYSGASK